MILLLSYGVFVFAMCQRMPSIFRARAIRARFFPQREVPLCLARGADQEQAYYGATLGSSEVAGWLWQQLAKIAGLTGQSKVHGVGDGARWIAEKFTDFFGDQGSRNVQHRFLARQ